jgi:hypothetical protein
VLTLYILILSVLQSTVHELSRLTTSIPSVSSCPNFIENLDFVVTVVPRYLNIYKFLNDLLQSAAVFSLRHVHIVT